MNKLITLLLLLLLSCKGESEIRPVEIHYGEDTCERCRMIITQKEFSAQYILVDGRAKIFDDIGCMVHSLEKEGKKVAAVFVRDYHSGEWIDGKEAFYIGSHTIKSPMGYGVIATKDRERAEKTAHQKGAKFFKGLEEVKPWVLEQR